MLQIWRLTRKPDEGAARTDSARAVAAARDDPGGELPGGTRIAELSMVEKLGVSRTPIRAALMRLERRRPARSLPNGGYAVRTFSERDMSDAIELRGTIEGLAARLAAERGVAPW
jgi:GntR family transcriptional regulator of vanillate catabolism